MTGQPIDPATRLREFIDLAVLADQGGLDVFGVGEHHRPDFASASPPVVLAAIAQATERIRLTSTVTVLSTADAVKVFEDFTAVDLISRGRTEITAGRGAYTDSFPLFGHDLANYDELFDEKLDLLLRLNRNERITWAGKHRPPLIDAGIYPRPVQGGLPVWIAVGGTPAGVVRAGRNGLALYLAILGQPERFAPSPTSTASPAPRPDTSPQEVIDKILWEHDLLGHDRFLAQIGLGGLPFVDTARSIELLATDVFPAISREITASKPQQTAAIVP